jgi:hypothetical protein
MVVTFCLVPEVRYTSHRAIGFLTGDPELDAGAAFMELGENQRRYVLSSMGEWIDGRNRPEKRFHAFPNDHEYKMCFAFRLKEKRLCHRFYGYICNPLPILNPSFQLCVLCIHARKTTWDTDRTILARVKTWYLSNAARQAIYLVYPDEAINTRRAPQWEN